MTAELWVALIVGLLGGGGLLKLIIKSGDWLQQRKSISIFADITAVYDAMGEIVRNTIAERILIFMTHNDGQEITPARKIYSSVLYEVILKPFISVKSKYQHLLLDGPYVKMIVNVLVNGSINLKTDNLEEGMIKAFFEHEGVKYATVYYLTDSEKKKLWYISIATSQDIEDFPDYERAIIIKNVEIISKILKKYAK